MEFNFNKTITLRTRICCFLITAFAICMACTQNTYCAVNTNAQNNPDNAFTIAVASDLHTDPANKEPGIINPLTQYNSEIIESLLWDLAGQKPDVLLICGDLANSGRESQHEALTEFLKAGEELGLTILVLPGNHDLTYTDSTEFTSYYKNFGYGEAISRDSTSLSYSAKVGNHLFLMLDTGGHTKTTQPSFSQQTLTWVEKQLSDANQKGLSVICAGHYPILTTQTEFTGRKEIIQLFQKYDMPLYLCGHLHGRNVNVEGNFCELVVEETTAYPCGYAMITSSSEGEYCYVPQYVNVQGWAHANNSNDINLLNFQSYLTDIQDQTSSRFAEELVLRGNLTDEESQKLYDFILEFQESIAKGYFWKVHDELQTTPGYEVFQKINGNDNYSKWLRSLFENPGLPYTSGFVIKDGTIHFE